MYDRDNGPGLGKVILFVTIILGIVVIFQFCLPRAATESIVSIPLKTEGEILNLATVGDSPCKLQLVTSEIADSRSKPFAYAELFIPVSRRSSSWMKQSSTGDCIVLHTPKEKRQIKVNANDLDLQFLPLLSSDPWPPDPSPMPVSFKPYINRVSSNHPYGQPYRVKGLKPDQPVTVVGRLELVDSEIWLRPFTAGAALNPVIVTILNPADLDLYLHANYPIGRTLGHAIGMGSDVETDPSTVGIPADAR